MTQTPQNAHTALPPVSVSDADATTIVRYPALSEATLAHHWEAVGLPAAATRRCAAGSALVGAPSGYGALGVPAAIGAEIEHSGESRSTGTATGEDC